MKNKEKLYTAREIQDLLTLPCCHVTGMHDPNHYEDGKYVCEKQIAEAFENLCRELEINPVVKHNSNCGWCHEYPNYKKGDGKKYWDQPSVCANCGYPTYTHEKDSYEGYCKNFVPLTFKSMLEAKRKVEDGA